MGRLSLLTQATPSTPAANTVEIFADTADNLVKQIDSSGTVRNMGTGRYYTLVTPAVTVGTSETVLFNLEIPANFAVAGQTYKITMFGNSSSTGTLTFRIREGATGGVGDIQAWTSTTSAAQVANARAGIDVTSTVRSIGGAGTTMTDGVAFAGAVVLPTLTGAPAVTTVNTTAIWYITVSCICSVGNFTAQVATIELVF